MPCSQIRRRRNGVAHRHPLAAFDLAVQGHRHGAAGDFDIAAGAGDGPGRAVRGRRTHRERAVRRRIGRRGVQGLVEGHGPAYGPVHRRASRTGAATPTAPPGVLLVTLRRFCEALHRVPPHRAPILVGVVQPPARGGLGLIMPGSPLSVPSTASASHSVTVRPAHRHRVRCDQAHGGIAVPERRAPNPEGARSAGAAPGPPPGPRRRSALSVAPTTTADEGAGGVSLSMSAHCAMASNSFPDSVLDAIRRVGRGGVRRTGTSRRAWPGWTAIERRDSQRVAAVDPGVPKGTPLPAAATLDPEVEATRDRARLQPVVEVQDELRSVRLRSDDVRLRRVRQVGHRLPGEGLARRRRRGTAAGWPPVWCSSPSPFHLPGPGRRSRTGRTVHGQRAGRRRTVLPRPGRGRVVPSGDVACHHERGLGCGIRAGRSGFR